MPCTLRTYKTCVSGRKKVNKNDAFAYYADIIRDIAIVIQKKNIHCIIYNNSYSLQIYSYVSQGSLTGGKQNSGHRQNILLDYVTYSNSILYYIQCIFILLLI